LTNVFFSIDLDRSRLTNLIDRIVDYERNREARLGLTSCFLWLILINTNMCVYSGTTVTRLSYFVYSSSMSPVIPGSPGVPEPAVSHMRNFLSFSGYGGREYTLLSPDTPTLYSRKQAFVMLVLERLSSVNKAKLLTLLNTTIINGECFGCLLSLLLHV